MTRIGVQAAAGRARLTLTHGPVSPRVLRVDDTGAAVGLVATTALLLGGDHIELEIDVGPGAWLELVETAGTVAYDADGVASSWTVRARLAERAVLIWAGEPFVVARGANVHRQTTIDLAEGAIACLRETLVLGRSGEIGGALRSTLTARLAGAPLLLDDLALGSDRDLPGVLGRNRVMDTASLLGVRAPTHPELFAGNRFDLDGPGTLARYLGTSTTPSPLSAITSAWRAAALEDIVAAATMS